jgi:hypothetical protein
MKSNTLIRVLGLTAILGGLMGIAADVASIFTTSADLTQMGLSLSLKNVGFLLAEKPHWQLVLGHYLAVLGIPLAGISVVMHTYFGLKPAGQKWARGFLLSGLLVVAMGVAYHATYGIAAEVVQLGDPALLQRANVYFEPFGILVSALFMVLVVGWTFLIFTGRTIYPRWVLFFSPLPVLCISSLFAYVLPVPNIGLRVFLMITNMNLPITIWAIVSTVVLWDRQIEI